MAEKPNCEAYLMDSQGKCRVWLNIHYARRIKLIDSNFGEQKTRPDNARASAGLISVLFRDSHRGGRFGRLAS
jgi:hypothetical protein